jgi:chaperonin GroES
MQPLNDYVVIQKIEPEEDQTSLIVLPTATKEKQPIGKVIAIGPGRYVENSYNIRVPMTVKIDDVVLFYEAASQKVFIEGEEYYIMAETNVFLILNKKGNKKVDG